MKAIVLGGAGYIGSVLCPVLLYNNWDVVIFDRFFFGRPTMSNGIELVQGDIRSINANVFDDVDLVIDLAGMSNDPSADLDPKITKDIHYSTVKAAKKAKSKRVSRYIYASSCSVYGHGEEKLLKETSPTNPVSLYAKTKLKAEQDLLTLSDKSFCVTILRNATVYGLSPRMRFDLVVNLMTLTAWQKGRVYIMGGGAQWRPLIHVEDVARAFMLIADKPVTQVLSQIFNIGFDDQNYQIMDIAKLIKRVMPTVELEVIPEDADKRTYNVSFEKLRRLGLIARNDVEKGIREIKQALEEGLISDTIKTRTVKYYQYLIEADKLLDEVKYKGKLF